MLSERQRELIDVVLVSPRNPLNIGAVARAMANFGLPRLTVVAPYVPHWREAKSAVGAPEILARARVAETLPEAVRDCSFVAGTGTLTHRKPEQPVIPLPYFSPLAGEALIGGARIAIVFGPEKHGLTRDDLSFCNVLVEIPTDTQQPSMNLGQAVAVCLYELVSRTATATDQAACETPPRQTARSASSGSFDLLAAVIDEVMEAARYSPDSMRNANRHDMRLMLRRLSPTEKDVRRILGLFRRILWRLHGKS